MRAIVKVAALSLVFATAICLGGCSTDSPGGDVELTWFKVTEATASTEDTINSIIADFEKENPGITVKVEDRSTDAHKDALRTTLGTTAAPDLFFSWTGPGLGGEFIEAGASLNLEKYYDEYGWKDRFTANTLAGTTQFGGYDGVPYTQRTEAIFYNKELFAEAGIADEPTSYDELVADAETLSAAGITPFEFGGTVNWHVMRLLDSILESKCGADTYQALVTNKASWADEPCVTDTYTQFALWTNKYVNPGFISINNDESSALFWSGKAAMALEGDWFNQQSRDSGMADENIGLFAFPTGTGRIYGFTENTYITSTSKHPDEAAKFLDFLSSDEEQAKFIATFGSRSVNKAVLPEDQPASDALWNDIVANATGVYVNNDQNFSAANTAEYWRIQNLVATGDMDPKMAGSEFQKFLEQQ